MTKNSYLIESISPLVFRSAKPFGAQSADDDAIFPLPSSAAGLLRAQGIEQNTGKLQDFGKEALNNADYQALLQQRAQGPFLVRFNPLTESYTVLLAKPANALYFENKATKQIELIRLSPKAIDSDLVGSDLPAGLMPVQMEKSSKGKPQAGVGFWSLEHFLQWQSGKALSFNEVQAAGANLPPLEVRTHVALDGYTLASKSGQLFQTASFDLDHPKKEDGSWEEERFGFLILGEQKLKKNAATFGGERRLSYLKPFTVPPLLEQPPANLLSAINQSKGLGLTFITPSIFSNGYLPSWLDQNTLSGTLPNTNTQVRLKACAIDRWMPVSGWDTILWKPKATRKAISAGSIYWFELQSDLSQDELNALWCESLACHPQDSNDGFGVALPFAWNFN